MVLFILFFLKPEIIKKLSYCLTAKTFLNRIRLVRLLQQKIEEILEAIQELKSKKLFFFLFFYSLFIWLCLYLVGFSFLKGVGLNFTFWQAVFIGSFPLVIAALPTQGIGGFGTTEGAWVIGLMLMGHSRQIAISAGFAFHLASIMFFVVLAALGFLMMKFSTNKNTLSSYVK